MNLPNRTPVIVRCSAAGVHAGYYDGHTGSEVTLRDSRRLWYWVAAQGAYLSGVAVHGVATQSMVGVTVPQIVLLDACEILVASPQAMETIYDLPPHRMAP